MIIEIEILERAVNVRAKDGKYLIKNGSLEDLLSLAQKYGRIIKRVKIKGDCESYTFKRQVFLFANLVNYLQGTSKQIFPRYRYDQKTSS